MDIWPILQAELDAYRKAVDAARRCLIAYEQESERLIQEISSGSFDEVQIAFDRLYEIQAHISTAQYKYEFPLTDRLRSFVYQMDRDDFASRRYWWERFRSGLLWPEQA